MIKTELNTNVHFDGVKCEICGCDSFSEIPKPTTMWSCNGTYRGERCKGLLCKCTKCNKYYMAEHFGHHGDVWECKTCGAVQWDFTDMMTKLEKIRAQEEEARRIRREIEAMRNSYY